MLSKVEPEKLETSFSSGRLSWQSENIKCNLSDPIDTLAYSACLSLGKSISGESAGLIIVSARPFVLACESFSVRDLLILLRHQREC